MLAGERVRFVGEEIALVIAETAAQARDAADLVEVDYDDLPVVIGVERAIEPDASSSTTIFRAMSASISNTATRRRPRR